VVHHLQRPYYPQGLRDSWWHGPRALLQLKQTCNLFFSCLSFPFLFFFFLLSLGFWCWFFYVEFSYDCLPWLKYLFFFSALGVHAVRLFVIGFCAVEF
jgi:hypothetical protein